MKKLFNTFVSLLLIVLIFATTMLTSLAADSSNANSDGAVTNPQIMTYTNDGAIGFTRLAYGYTYLGNNIIRLRVGSNTSGLPNTCEGDSTLTVVSNFVSKISQMHACFDNSIDYRMSIWRVICDDPDFDSLVMNISDSADYYDAVSLVAAKLVYYGLTFDSSILTNLSTWLYAEMRAQDYYYEFYNS